MHAALSDPSYANPQALLQIDSYGCRINAVSPEATAVPQRSSVMKLQYQTYWTDAAQDAVNLDWDPSVLLVGLRAHRGRAHAR